MTTFIATLWLYKVAVMLIMSVTSPWSTSSSSPLVTRSIRLDEILVEHQG